MKIRFIFIQFLIIIQLSVSFACAITQPIEKLLFSLSSKIDVASVPVKEKRIVKKAIDAVSAFERILTDYQLPSFSRYPLLQKGMSDFIALGNQIAQGAPTIEELKPWDMRKLQIVSASIVEKTLHYLGDSTIISTSPQDRDVLLTIQEVCSLFVRYILNPQFISVGSRLDQAADMFYYRPKEWITLHISGQKPVDLTLVKPTVKPLSNESSWNELRQANMVQYCCYSQFGLVTKYCRSSGVFCGGHAIALLNKTLDESNPQKIQQIARDYESLKNELIVLDAKTAAMRIDNLFGKSDYSQLEVLPASNIAQWLAARSKEQDFTAKSLGEKVVEYFKKHADQIEKEGVYKWASKKEGEVTNHQKLCELTKTDWHVESELEHLINEDRITVITDTGMYNPRQDILGYLSHYSNEKVRTWLEMIDQSSLERFEDALITPKGAIVSVNHEVLKQSKALWKKIQDLRNNGIAQGVIIRDGAHWFCAKIVKTGSDAYEMIVLDTMNLNRLDNATVRSTFNLFTSLPLPNQKLFEEYIRVGIYAVKESSLFDQKQKKELNMIYKQTLEYDHKKILNELIYHMIILAHLGIDNSTPTSPFIHGIRSKLADIFKDRILYLIKQRHVVSPFVVTKPDNTVLGSIELNEHTTFEQFLQKLLELASVG